MSRRFPARFPAIARIVEGLQTESEKVPFGISGGYKDYTLEYAFEDKKLRDQCLKWIAGLVGPNLLQADDNPKHYGPGDVMHVFRRIESWEDFKSDPDVSGIRSHHKRYGA